MDEFASRFADFLEQTAGKVRSLSVDRLNRALRQTALGIVVAVLALVAVIFVIVAVFRTVAHYTSVEIAYAIFGGLFVLAGAFVWSKRDTERTKDAPNA